MRLPNWASKRSWKPGDRVVVAVGQYKGERGSVYLRAERGKYLVTLDSGITEKFDKGKLDPE